MHLLYAVREAMGGVIIEVNYIHTEVTVRVAARWAAVHCRRIAARRHGTTDK